MSPEITPNEIVQKRFSRFFRGLNPDEVHEFLRVVASEFEVLLRENMLLSEKIKQLEQALEEFRQMEGTLKNTLVSSQKIGQQIKEEAERKGNLVIREAELEAERIINKAKRRKERLEEETFQILSQHRRFRAEFLALMQTHRDIVQSQDSRLLLEHGVGDLGSGESEPEPEITVSRDKQFERHKAGEEEIEDLEILFPEERE